MSSTSAPATSTAATATASTDEKLAVLQAILREMQSVMVAFSAGVDSTLLLAIAVETLGERAVAATGLSGSYAPEEMREATELAERIGARHLSIETMELTDPRYANNTHQRCFFCKDELYRKLLAAAEREGTAFVLDGSNADDTGDFRPGMRAAKSLGIRSPLLEAGLTKREIRALARERGLPVWDKPAAACLSSRFAYGDPITVDKLRQVAKAETFLRSLGYRGFRVRHHDTVARLELPPELIGEVIERREEIVAGIKAAGYQYVAIDLEGFRSGSMNEVLNARLKQGGLRRPSAV